jgi:hypothetical protein
MICLCICEASHNRKWELITNPNAGIISTLAFCSSHPSHGLYAAGSLSPSSANSANIALFDEHTAEKPVGWVGDVKASVMQVRL